MVIGITYIIFMFLIGNDNILFNINYFKTVLITIKYIVLYFIIKDSYTMLANYIYKFTSKLIIVNAFQLIFLYSLFNYFIITACILITGAVLIDLKFNIRENTEGYLRKINIKNQLC